MRAIAVVFVPFRASKSSREADTAQQILETGVGPQRIKDGAQQDGRVESRFVGHVQPIRRLVWIAESHIDQGHIGVDRP
jgi:hypothetical protein